MIRPFALLLLFAGAAAAADPKDKDDPLPFGATKRFGSRKFLRDSESNPTALRPDGKAYACWVDRGGVGLTITDAAGRVLTKTPLLSVGGSRHLGWSADAKHLLAVGSVGAEVYAVATGKVAHTWQVDYKTHSVTFLAATPDLRTVVLESTDDKQKQAVVAVWQPFTGKPPVEWKATQSSGRHWAALTDDGKRVALFAWGASIDKLTDEERAALRERERTADVWDVAKQESVGRHPLPMNGFPQPGQLKFFPDGDTLLIPGRGTQLLAYRLSTDTPGREFVPAEDKARHKVGLMRVSADGKAVLGISSNEVKVWDAATAKRTAGLTVRPSQLDVTVLDAIFPTSGPPVALVQEYRRVRLVPITGEQTSFPVGKEHTGPIVALRAGKDGRVVSVGADRLIVRWDPATGRPVSTLTFDDPEWQAAEWPSGTNRAVAAVSPDATRVALPAGVVAVGQAPAKLLFKLKDVDVPKRNGWSGFPPQWRFAWSADGKRLAGFWSRDDGKDDAHGVVVYDPDGKIVFEATVLTGQSRAEFEGDLSADGKTAVGRSAVTAAGKTTATLTVWDVTAGQEVAKRSWDEADSRGVFVTLSPDGRSALTNNGRSAVRVPLNKLDDEQKLKFAVYPSSLGSRVAVYAPDRKSLVVNNEYLYDDATGQIAADLRPQRADDRRTDLDIGVRATAFSPDGKVLYLGCGDGTVLAYPYPLRK